MRDSKAGGRGPAPLSRLADELAPLRDWAKHFAQRGRRVWCEQCNEEHRVRTDRTARLRSFACERCGGRLRQARWFKRRAGLTS